MSRRETGLCVSKKVVNFARCKILSLVFIKDARDIEREKLFAEWQATVDSLPVSSSIATVLHLWGLESKMSKNCEIPNAGLLYGNFKESERVWSV